jgi:phage N-6-adenine-methyltransferase
MPTFTEDEYEDSTDEYATPKSFLRPLADAVGGFDLDPCSGAEADPHADETYTKEDDGLTQPWFGTVFCNPPFSEKTEWLQKAIEETNEDNADLVVMVLPVDTSTRWFHNYVTQSAAVGFIGPGRQDFDRRGDAEADGNPSFAVMIPVFGREIPPELLGYLNTRGVVYHNRALYTESTQVRFQTDGGRNNRSVDTDTEQ